MRNGRASQGAARALSRLGPLGAAVQPRSPTPRSSALPPPRQPRAVSPPLLASDPQPPCPECCGTRSQCTARATLWHHSRPPQHTLPRAAPAPDCPKHTIAHGSHASSLPLHSPVHPPSHGRFGATPYSDSPAHLPQRLLCAFSVVVEELAHRSSVLHHGPHLLRAPSPPQVEVRAQARYAAPQGDPPVVDNAAKREAARRHTDEDRHAAAARRKDDRLDVLARVRVVAGGHDAELVIQAYEEECLMTEAPTWRRDRVCLGETYRSRTRAEVRVPAKLRRDDGPSGGHKVAQEARLSQHCPASGGGPGLQVATHVHGAVEPRAVLLPRPVARAFEPDAERPDVGRGDRRIGAVVELPPDAPAGG